MRAAEPGETCDYPVWHYGLRYRRCGRPAVVAATRLDRAYAFPGHYGGRRWRLCEEHQDQAPPDPTPLERWRHSRVSERPWWR